MDTHMIHLMLLWRLNEIREVKISYKSLRQWSLNFSVHQNLLQGLLGYRLLFPNLRVSNSVGLAWISRISIFNKFPDDADDTRPRMHFENHCSKVLYPYQTLVVVMWTHFLSDPPPLMKLCSKEWSAICLQGTLHSFSFLPSICHTISSYSDMGACVCFPGWELKDSWLWKNSDRARGWDSSEGVKWLLLSGALSRSLCWALSKNIQGQTAHPSNSTPTLISFLLCEVSMTGKFQVETFEERSLSAD